MTLPIFFTIGFILCILSMIGVFTHKHIYEAKYPRSLYPKFEEKIMGAAFFSFVWPITIVLLCVAGVLFSGYVACDYLGKKIGTLVVNWKEDKDAKAKLHRSVEE